MSSFASETGSGLGALSRQVKVLNELAGVRTEFGLGLTVWSAAASAYGLQVERYPGMVSEFRVLRQSEAGRDLGPSICCRAAVSEYAVRELLDASVSAPKVIAVVFAANLILVHLDCGHRLMLASEDQVPTTGSIHPCPQCDGYHAVKSVARKECGGSHSANCRHKHIRINICRCAVEAR